MFLVSHLKVSLASVQKDFVEEFNIFFFHKFIGIDSGALVEPQVNQFRGVANTLRHSKQNTLHITNSR